MIGNEAIEAAETCSHRNDDEKKSDSCRKPAQRNGRGSVPALANELRTAGHQQEEPGNCAAQIRAMTSSHPTKNCTAGNVKK